MNAAVRSNVAFYPVDTRGLVATAPMGDARQGSPGGRGMYSGRLTGVCTQGFQSQQETLYTLAADTGGKALFDQNDLCLGIVQAQKDISSYCLTARTRPPTASLGGRRSKVESISTRSSIAARAILLPETFANSILPTTERQLHKALLLGAPVADLSLALEVNYFRFARDRYFVPVAVKIPGSDIELGQETRAG